MEWYYADNNEQKGPVEKEELERMYAQGLITDNTLVWCESMSDWQPYKQAIAKPSQTVSSVPPPQSVEHERDPNVSFEKVPSGMTLSVVMLCISVLLTCLMPCPGILPLIPAIFAMIYSSQVVSRSQNGDYQGALNCSRNAKVFGIITILLILLMMLALGGFFFWAYQQGGFDTHQRSKTSRAQADMRTLATAVESYYIDHNAYPQYLRQATTPISYIYNIPEDAFSPGNPIQYMDVKFDIDGKQKEGWMLWSIGPDGYDDVEVDQVEERLKKTPNDPALAFYDLTYDPTNGTKSDGDIFRFGGNLDSP